MGPVELLRNKRNALVSDDEAILLLLLAKGQKRPHELRDESQMPERTFWRILRRCEEMEWTEATKARPSGKGVGRGLKTVVGLTSKGEQIAGRILGVIKMAIDGVPAIESPPPCDNQPTLL